MTVLPSPPPSKRKAINEQNVERVIRQVLERLGK
jgi:hypothetical protein